MIINLLKETEKALSNHKLSFKNVKYILNKEGCIPISVFVDIAKGVNYENGYGSVNIDPTLKIVGTFWWLERFNYDGYEGWIYHKKPKCPTLIVTEVDLREDRYPCNSEDFIEK